MAFPNHLALATFTTNNGFKLSGVAAFDNSGTSVASAGDVNGDGFDDLIVGARLADPHGLQSGAAYVVFGQGGTFPLNIDLDSLNSLNGFRIVGVAANDKAGVSVASAGDINGDGFSDLIIGAYGVSNYTGASYVLFGKAAGFAASIDMFDGSNGFTLSGGGSTYDYSGCSVASAGDVNGDGFDDLIIGAFRATGFGPGAAYVVFGKATNFDANVDLSKLDGTNGFKLGGEAKGDFAGISVASAGDVNGDGFDDLIVGAPKADPHGEASGAAYVLFGKAGGFAKDIDLASLAGTGSPGFKISGVAADDLAGSSVASAGDINGDGFGDLIIGAPGADPHNRVDAGAAYVVFGQPAFQPNIDLSSLNGSNGFALIGSFTSFDTGESVASAGDVNGDGFDDLIVGASGYSQSNGASYVVFGHAPGFSSELDLADLETGELTFGSVLSGANGEYSGRAVASAGDVNGDGLADLIVGAPFASPHGSYSGASYVVFGDLVPVPNFPFASSLDVTEVLYVGYFGRAGDPGGTDFWLGALDLGFTGPDAAASFSVQVELKALYAFLANPSAASQAEITSFIGSVYQDLFNRAPDPGGLSFWQDYLSSHLGDPHSVGTFILAVVNGAQEGMAGHDQSTITNKVAAAEFLTESFTRAGIEFNLTPSAANALAHSNIAGVTFDRATLLAAEDAVSTFVQMASNTALVGISSASQSDGIHL